jgi:hypothetical protein
MKNMATNLRRTAFIGTLAAGSLLTLALEVSLADDRAVVQEKFSFRYVDQPNNTAASYIPQVLDNAAIAGGTENGAFWSNGAMGRLHGLVRALLRDSRNGGSNTLQHYAAKVVRIVDKPIIVYLIEDSGGALTNVASERFGVCLSTNNRAWPCATNMSTADDFLQECYQRIGQPVPARRDGTWGGQMALGAFHTTQNTQEWTNGTFVHELLHTQDRTDNRGHLFRVSGRLYRYGADDVHYTTELVPNRAMTYMEGIANTISLLFDGREQTRYFQWFSTNGAALVEKALVPPGTGVGTVHQCFDVTSPSPDVWLYNQLQARGVPEAPAATPNIPAGYAAYRIRNLPPKFIVHNEFILALIFSKYVEHIRFDPFIDAIRHSNANLYRASGSGVAVLFDVLCSAGLPAGETASSLVAAQANQSGPKPYLLPLAYADYFTAYQSRTKADYAQIFENLLPSAWVDLYWDGYSTAVRTAVPISATPRQGDLTSIAIALGITSSTPEH